MNEPIKKYDCIVIGGGAVGALTLRRLQASGISCALFEAGSDLASGATRANSAVVHAGFDPEPGTLKAKMNVAGAALFPGLARELDIPFLPIPSLVAAYNAEELNTVEGLYARGRANGVTELKLLSQSELRQTEPNIIDSALGALWAASAIIEPWTVAIAAAENAADNGAEVHRSAPVTGIEATDAGYRVTVRQGADARVYAASAIVNAAGIHADEIHNMAAAPTFQMKGKLGQYYVLDRGAAGLVRNVLFPCPSEKGKGILILPEIHGRVMVGPDSVLTTDKTSTPTNAQWLKVIKKAVSAYLKVQLPYNLTIRSFAGLRPASDRGDFILEEAPGAPGFFDAAGIESPGLASSPAIAEYMADMVLNYLGLDRGISPEFNPCRRPRLTTESAARAGLPGSSRIVCRCEKITEAVILDCIHRNVGAVTVKGVKMRASAGAGGCQGGYCQPEVVKLLARELHIAPEEVLYDGPGSNILTGKTRGGDCND